MSYSKEGLIKYRVERAQETFEEAKQMTETERFIGQIKTLIDK